MKYIFTVVCLLAAARTFAQSPNNNVGIGTAAPLAQLDVVGDTLGLRKAGAPQKNFWINLTGNAVNINASDAANGITFKLGLNNGGGTSPYAGQLNPVMTLNPYGRVGIGTTNPDYSAELEVRSTSRGVLIPRMSTTQRNAIINPAVGLLVYDSTAKAFYYYQNGWSHVGDNLGNHTATQTINTNGNKLSGNGGSNGLLLDNAGNATLDGKLTATGATLTGTGGSAYDYLIKNTAGGDVGTRKGFGAVGICYIIALGGAYPLNNYSTGQYNLAFIGEIRPFAPGPNAVPAGWAVCNGQLLLISSNTPLYALIGTTYGGDGITTFGLPDLRGAVPVGEGTAPAGYIWNSGQVAY